MTNSTELQDVTRAVVEQALTVVLERTIDALRKDELTPAQAQEVLDSIEREFPEIVQD